MTAVAQNRRGFDEREMKIGFNLALLPAAALALLVGCGDDEVEVERADSPLDVIQTRSELSTLAALVESAGLEGELSDPGAGVTLFAPSNAAFDALPEELTTYLEANLDVLRDVLRYHVALERRPEGSLNPIDDEEILTAQGETIIVIGTQPRIIRIADQTGATFGLLREDLPAGGSVVHIIDGVMLPGPIEVGPGTLVDVAKEAGQFGSLLTAASELTVAGQPLAEVLEAPGPTTLFAPTDPAFQDLGVDLSTLENDTDLGDVLTNILLAHVAAGDRSAADLDAAGAVPTEARVAFEFLPADAEMPATIGGAALAQTDVEASNGRIHVLSEVILPPTLLEVATSTPGLSTLVDVVNNQASDAVRDALTPNALDGDRPLTVLAPDDTAFSEADLDGEDLDRVLQYHVIEGQLTADDLFATPDGAELETLGGETLTVTNDAGMVALQDGRGRTIELLATDVRSINGIIHVVDTVLLPPESPEADLSATITELSTDPMFPDFGSLLLTAGVEVDGVPVTTTLAGPGPFTVFAPTDAAFANLGLDLTSLDEDEDLQAVVANVLFTHVLPRDASADDLAAAGTVQTLAKTPIDYVGTASPPTIGGARLNLVDIEASNGTLHIVDDVIVPPTLLQLASATSTLSSLASAVQSAGATVRGAVDPDVFSGDRPITIFAPVNAAFAASDLSEEDLDAVLAYHVVLGQVTAEDLRGLTDGTTIATAQGSLLTVQSRGAIVELVDARGNTIQVLDENIRARNGVIHAVDRVMLPPQ